MRGGAQAWEESLCGVRYVCVGVCARVHACFLFVMGTIEFGAFFY